MALGASPEASLTTPLSLWWPLGEQLHPDIGWAELPAGLVQMTHPLIAVLPIPLALLYWRRGRAVRPEDVLALLALLFLLRCVLDPYDNGYYHLPFLFSLAAYEGLCRQRFPLLSVLASAVLWINIDLVWSDGHFDLSNAIYLASMLPLVGYLALVAFGSVGSRGWQRHPGPTGPALPMGWADRRQS
jgi:hypothetical protein